MHTFIIAFVMKMYTQITNVHNVKMTAGISNIRLRN